MVGENAYAVLQFENLGLGERPLMLRLAGHYLKSGNHFLQKRIIDEYVLIYCEEGSGWVELNEMKTTVSKGDIIFLPPNQYHSYGNEPGGTWSIIWFHFTGCYGEYFYNQTNAARSNGVIHALPQNSFDEAFKTAITSIITTKSPTDILNAEAALTTILCRLSETTKHSIHKDSIQKAYIDKAIAILEKSDSYFVSLDKLSGEVGISKYYLIRLFREYVGTTPKEYINILKLKKACKLLKETNLSMLEISLLLGFYNQYHFSKSFKQFSGYSPTKFRKFI